LIKKDNPGFVNEKLQSIGENINDTKNYYDTKVMETDDEFIFKTLV